MSTTGATDATQISIDNLLQKYRAARAIKDKELGIVTKEHEGKGHAIGYTRVSTIMQAEDGSSMDSQRTAIETYCKNKNLILDDIIDEPAKSGADRERHKLKELINSMKPGTKLVCYSIDRVSRDARFLLDIKEILQMKGCSMYFIDRGIDTSNTENDLLITIMAAIATENRKAQNKNISAVMQDMSSKGTLRTRPRYGWKVVNKEIIPDEEEQAVIGMIREFIRIEPNISLSRIASRLELSNIKIRKCAKIYPTTIKNIIEHNNLRKTSIVQAPTAT